jgi:digeranylgeranylglycerophospholipid reductase
MEKNFDVIVIGAGFGGSVAAKLCSDAGLKTLLLERSENVGDKVISGLTIPFQGFLFAPTYIRDGNPPFERPSDGIDNYIIKDIDKGDIYVDNSLKVPKPLSPIISFGYNTYCKPFCQWLSRKAIDAGVELRTSTTVIDFIKEDGTIRGILTDKGENIRSKIIINSEGSQGLLAIKAGMRKKYPPETISLADTYDYVMSKKDIDKIFGFSVKMCWGWDEQKIAPPLGYGNGLMVWPYRNSLHFMQDQCLRMDEKKVPNLKKVFNEYHHNITSKLSWWRDLVSPRIKLRARTWEGFEIYVGLDKNLRKLPKITDGMILIGDVAGLESTELCDGVPAAWFSAEIAAGVAIEAIKANNASKLFLKRYTERISRHPIIQWSISGINRYNLRLAQQEHSFKTLKKYIHNGWGLGTLSSFTTPFLQLLFLYIRKDPNIITKWIKMYFRYFQNWLHENFDYGHQDSENDIAHKKITKKETSFLFFLRIIDRITKKLIGMKKMQNLIVIPLANSMNRCLEIILPIFEPIYSLFLKLTYPIRNKLSKKLISFVDGANPSLFSI